MKDYIEEMMKTVGVKKNNCENCNQELDAYCLIYECDKKDFPDFTAEKQLEIIKFIGLQGNVCIVKRYYADCNWMITTHHKNGAGDNQDFAQALAQLTTELMKAGELDKEKVKEILEG